MMADAKADGTIVAAIPIIVVMKCAPQQEEGEANKKD
jgi:hypothetical protein